MTRPPAARAAVVGAGLIGAGWSALFLAHGIDVKAWDPDPGARPALEELVASALEDLRELGLEGSGQLDFAATLEEALEGAEFVQENAPEREELKTALLAEIDALAPTGAIIASSTSSLLRSHITRACGDPERVVIGHPFNPPHLIPLVEIVGPAPDAASTRRAVAFYEALGKETVVLKKEARGHLINRINSALWREAVSLYQQGLADPADIDRAIKAGPALRWPFLGPYETYHLGGGEGGIRHYFEHLQPIQEERWKEMPTPELDDAFRARIIESVEKAMADRSVAQRARERDRRLLAMLKLRAKLTQQEPD
ncbi:MAG: 3-hydroxyacyl-CoA dehydrogenase [Alphaproteobacteria bacterium]|nr:MAG: 3-hydroxyacyl-CoA dehydrogenase [Alphaproteobacteria bacterium]